MPGLFPILFGILHYLSFLYGLGKNAIKTFVNRTNAIRSLYPKAIAECQLLTELPFEIRYVIYELLLVSAKPITRAHELVGSTPTILAANVQLIEDIHIAITRTCWLIYRETMPVLYGRNTFRFASNDEMLYFSSRGLRKVHPAGE